MEHTTSIMRSTKKILSYDHTYSNNTLSTRFKGCSDLLSLIQDFKMCNMIITTINSDSIKAIFDQTNLSNMTTISGVMNLYKSLGLCQCNNNEIITAIDHYLQHVIINLNI